MISLVNQQLSGDEVVSALICSRACKVLQLQYNQVGDEHVHSILKLPQYHKITYLNLSNNRIGDEGALSLVRSSHHNNISCLWLARNNISAEGIVRISGLLPGSRVTILDLWGNPGSRDARAFAALWAAARQHKILTYLVDLSSVVQSMAWVEVHRENRNYVERTTQELVTAVRALRLHSEVGHTSGGAMFSYILNRPFVHKFEQFYYNESLNEKILKEGRTACKIIQIWIRERYFHITGVVRDSILVDNAHLPTLAVLPPEVLRYVAQFLKVTDVKYGE